MLNLHLKPLNSIIFYLFIVIWLQTGQIRILADRNATWACKSILKRSFRFKCINQEINFNAFIIKGVNATMF